MRTSRRAVLAIPIVLALAACTSEGTSEVVDTTSPSESDATAPAVTEVTSSTSTSSTTMEPSTTAASTVHEVAFHLAGEQVMPLDFGDERVRAAVIHSEATGDLVGPLTTAETSVGDWSLALVWFEGTAGPCGTGGMAMRIGDRPDGETGWEVVDGLGTGDLARVTGGGLGSATGFEGEIDCDGPAHPGVVDTDLLEPVPSEGVPVSIPPHIGQEHVVYDVTPHPAQTNPPKDWWMDLQTYDTMLMLHDFMWPGDPRPLRNTYAAFGFGDPVCGSVPSVARVLADDIEYPEYTGVLDFPAALNGGAHGAGVFRADVNENRVICPAS